VSHANDANSTRPIPGPPPLYANVGGPPRPLSDYPAAYRASAIVGALISLAPGERNGPAVLPDDDLDALLGSNKGFPMAPKGGEK
jgi:hypothetical protein